MISTQQQDLLSFQDRTLPRFRPELVAIRQFYDGLPYWVVKDPFTLRYFRFNREEYFIIEQLRRSVTLDQLKEAHRREFQDDSLSAEHLGQFIRSLMARNLLDMPQPNRDELLYNAGRKRWRARLVSQFSNFMFFRIPLYDPDRLFNRIHPHIKFLWSNTFCGIFLLVLALATALIIRRWDDFASMFHGEFFTLRNLPMLFLTIWFIKALHEFGHGFTCKNYGGEVHELGWLFLVFTPFFYCNVTDSWTFPDKKHRLLVTAGGILTEVFCAALAVFLWYFTDQPQFLHALAFNVIIACSLSTVLFNANPLLKYDGYYFLMDLIEVPNLRQRSSQFVRNLFIRNLLGGRPEELPEQNRFRGIFPLYAVAAWFYRIFIVFAILFMVYRLLQAVRLVWLGRFLFAFSLLTMLVLPMFKTSRLLVTQRRELGISNSRLFLLLAIIISLAASALFLPYSQTVTLNFLLEPVRAHMVRADVDGRLEWTPAVQEGAWVGAPQASVKLASLSNPELRLERQKLQAEIDQLNLQIAQLKNAGRTSISIRQLEDRCLTLQKHLARLDQQLAALDIYAPFPAEILITDRDRDLLQGCYCSWGDPLLLIGDTRQLTAKVWVPEKTWARIFRGEQLCGQHAELLLYAFTDQTFTGVVSDASSRAEIDMGAFNEKLALSNKVGGEVLTEFDPTTGREKPLEAVYEITITLDNPDALPPGARPYMSGRVRIDCGNSTLYQWTRDSILRFISPEVRL